MCSVDGIEPTHVGEVWNIMTGEGGDWLGAKAVIVREVSCLGVFNVVPQKFQPKRTSISRVRL